MQAAEEIAAGARGNAARWSRSVPPSIRTEQVDESTVNIVSDAPAAYPNEADPVWHPTFGHRPRVKNAHRPFLAPAAEERAGAAMDKFAQVIDRRARERGWGPQ
jgi:hypothetical protein